ncbi:hypothetical protein PIB30_096940 [Stylosanthes scabra]|uniref:Uncharacterized protein n=1 Tax=Stylosanthes scabra TaxID=79078 RepID=A0ABU6TVM4_9FABA|nr:hypothetical protein [Stylosanthes scabra]
MTQLNTINKKLEKLEASAVGTQVICGICGGPHENHNCISVQDDQFSAAQVNSVGNQPRLPYNDPHSNTYNPSWRNHPNFSWGGNQGQQKQYNNQNHCSFVRIYFFLFELKSSLSFDLASILFQGFLNFRIKLDYWFVSTVALHIQSNGTNEKVGISNVRVKEIPKGLEGKNNLI